METKITTETQTDTPIVRPTCIPPKLFKRNEYGLICDDSVKYVYHEDGRINWRKMVKPEYLVPHKEVFQRTSRLVPTSIDGLEDKELLILLGGLRQLAAIRGYKSLDYVVTTPSPDYVAVVCSIGWIGNYETNGDYVLSSGVSDARPENTSGFGKIYLAPFAENRAFVRCVRQFLGIEIVSEEEISQMSVTASEDVVTGLLKEVTTKYEISFETIKKKLIEENFDDASKFNDWTDIPRFKQLELVERIKRKAAQREQASSSKSENT